LPPRFGSDELRTLYERYAPVIHRHALRLLGRDAEAWDSVQEVFRILLEKGSHFRGHAQPMTYVYRITVNVALGTLRARVLREQGQATQAPEEMVEPGEAEARSVLASLAKALSGRDLQIAGLHFVDGLSQEEIGQVVGLSRKSVGIHLERIRITAGQLAGGSHG
jgi:RNA polymerase sigma-70 factor (ECF subfamily)